jgi:predicted SAM-dependent methyltransferase
MHPFNRSYFQGVGYKGLFLDFPLHYKIAEDLLNRKPHSVLEVGGARGYICRILGSHGIKAVCMDISEHCWYTRALDSFVLHDATVVPWKFKNQEFDLCFSKDFMEHLPPDKVSTVIKEMARVSRRGYHKITFAPLAPNDSDPTHRQGTIKPREWWVEKFSEVAPDYPVEVDEKDSGIYNINIIEHAPPDSLAKLNIGCWLDQFHYGWENWDAQNLSEWSRQNGYLFRQVDVKNGVPKPDNSTDIILASHFIEHLNREDGERFLRECFRVLKHNGLVRLAVPDLKLLAEKYLKGKIMEYRHVNVGVENALDGAEAFFHLLLAGHQTVYDYDSLKKLLEKAGFKNVKWMEPFKSQSDAIMKQTIPAYPTLSIYLEAFKPEAEKPLYKQYLEGKIQEGKMALP